MEDSSAWKPIPAQAVRARSQSRYAAPDQAIVWFKCVAGSALHLEDHFREVVYRAIWKREGICVSAATHIDRGQETKLQAQSEVRLILDRQRDKHSVAASKNSRHVFNRGGKIQVIEGRNRRGTHLGLASTSATMRSMVAVSVGYFTSQPGKQGGPTVVKKTTLPGIMSANLTERSFALPGNKRPR